MVCMWVVLHGDAQTIKQVYGNGLHKNDELIDSSV
jgi:hypothetical protein